MIHRFLSLVPPQIPRELAVLEGVGQTLLPDGAARADPLRLAGRLPPRREEELDGLALARGPFHPRRSLEEADEVGRLRLERLRIRQAEGRKSHSLGGYRSALTDLGMVGFRKKGVEFSGRGNNYEMVHFGDTCRVFSRLRAAKKSKSSVAHRTTTKRRLHHARMVTWCRNPHGRGNQPVPTDSVADASSTQRRHEMCETECSDTLE